MKKHIATYATADLLAGKVPVNSTITAHGWVRTRRDSKAGVSFIALSDGSGFEPLQVVAANSLPNYQEEILKLTSGCAIIATGKLVASPAVGQPVELQAENIEVVGWIDDPDTYPISPKYHTLEYLREHANCVRALMLLVQSLALDIVFLWPFIGFFTNVDFIGFILPLLPQVIAKVLVKCYV